MPASAKLEFVQGTSNKFWTITLDGKTVTRTWGRKGTKGPKPKVDKFPNEYLAAADYARRLKAQLRQGYVQVEEIEADPATILTKLNGARLWVWSIRQDGHKLYITHGIDGSRNSRQSIPTASKDAASKEYRRRVSEKLTDGYQTTKTQQKPDADATEDAPSSSNTVINVKGKRVPRLQGERAVVIKIGYSQFEQFVQDMLDIDSYSFVADQECGNDSQHEMDASGELDDYELNRVEKFIKTGNVQFISGHLLNYFVSKGWLEAGTYLISVCW